MPAHAQTHQGNTAIVSAARGEGRNPAAGSTQRLRHVDQILTADEAGRRWLWPI
jgi:hypothetical protein